MRLPKERAAVIAGTRSARLTRPGAKEFAAWLRRQRKLAECRIAQIDVLLEELNDPPRRKSSK
jgi:hypothetical protein